MHLPHWDYYVAIEGDLERCSRFVEFQEDNFKTFSIEFARIIMAASAEVDTIMKLFCGAIDPSKSPDKITHYLPIILSKYPKFREFEIILKRREIRLTPWKEWTNDDRPEWWKIGYNKVKHERDKYFTMANLTNAMHSVAGLLSCLLYYYKQIHGQLVGVDYAQSPRIFMTEQSGISTGLGHDLTWIYQTPDEIKKS